MGLPDLCVVCGRRFESALPPVVVVHGTSLDSVPDSYKRYIEGRVRDHFKLVGTPLRLQMRSADNPFDKAD
jgi:GTP-binding protein